MGIGLGDINLVSKELGPNPDIKLQLASSVGGREWIGTYQGKPILVLERKKSILPLGGMGFAIPPGTIGKRYREYGLDEVPEVYIDEEMYSVPENIVSGTKRAVLVHELAHVDSPKFDDFVHFGSRQFYEEEMRSNYRSLKYARDEFQRQDARDMIRQNRIGLTRCLGGDKEKAKAIEKQVRKRAGYHGR